MWHHFTMTFRKDVNLDPGRVSTSSGGRGGVIAAGGGLGSLVLVGLFLLLGGNPAELGGLLGGGHDQVDSADGGDYSLDHCVTGEDANKYDDCRMVGIAASVDEVWSKVLPEQANIDYVQPGVHLFRDSVSTGCGSATSATGPFYCPKDRTAYLDVSFFEQLAQLGGSNGPLAQEYIVAHEIGHHIQNLEGTLGLSNYEDPGADSNAVKIELQADCYGGIWAHYANNSSSFESFTDEQLRDALDTAGAVGDDNIQRRSGGRVNPESFTHGTSKQREQAFKAGFESGKMSQCDTLGRGGYRG